MIINKQWKLVHTVEGQLNKPDNNQSEEKRLEAWHKFDREEDRIMSILASEMADPGSTGCGPDWEFELPENPRDTDE